MLNGEVRALADKFGDMERRVAAVEAADKDHCEQCCKCCDELGALKIRLEGIEAKLGTLDLVNLNRLREQLQAPAPIEA